MIVASVCLPSDDLSQCLPSYWVLEKAEELEIKLSTSAGSSKKQESSRIDYAKAFDCVDHNKFGKFWKRWEYQTICPPSWETCIQVRKQQLELDMEQQTGSK